MFLLLYGGAASVFPVFWLWRFPPVDAPRAFLCVGGLVSGVTVPERGRRDAWKSRRGTDRT